MKEIILIKNGELALKGLNRSSFESTLAKNIKRRLQSLGKFNVIRSQSTITVEPFDEGFDMEEAEDQISRIFGIAGYERRRSRKGYGCNPQNDSPVFKRGS